MSAAFASHAAPPNHLRVWCDTKYIYVELPNKSIDAPACVLSYPRSGRGFADLLSLLYGHADNSGLMPENFHAGKKLVGTATQHAQAAATLRKMGIVK
jgi:hypothetical protein